MRLFSFSIICFLVAVHAAADDIKVGGHLKHQISIQDFEEDDFDNVLGPERPISNEFDFRLNASKWISDFEFVAHAEFLGLQTDGLRTRESGLNPNLLPSSFNSLSDDDRRLFDLSSQIVNEEKFDAFLRLDRFYFSYTKENLVIKVGRQAISWGNGLLFQALDPYNPFSPAEIDKDYKSGDDMLYAQWLFDSGSDLQLISIPRRNPITNAITEEESSFAAKYHGQIEASEVDYDLLVSRHYGEALYGIGLSKEILEAIWRFDISFVDLEDEGTSASIVANVDYSWVFLEKNFYSFIEYYHSGVGVDRDRYTLIPERLLERTSRGEVFTLGKNYLATGLRFEATPILNIFGSHFLNLDDRSGLAQVRVNFDLLQDLTLQFGVDVPYGGRGDEFGGIPTGAGSFLTAGNRAYLRSSYFY